MNELASFAHLLDGTPVVVRAIVGLLGLVLLLRGARWYEPSIRLGAFGAGALGGVSAVRAIALWWPIAWQPAVVIAFAIVGGVIVTLTALATHRLVLVGLGALLGLVAGVAAQALVAALAWWVPLVSAVTGLVLFPLLYRKLLPITTSAVGAMLIAEAAGLADRGWVILVLWLAGVLVQRRPPPEA